MSLSKVYRGREFSELESFQFRSFSDEGAPEHPAERPVEKPPQGASPHEIGEAFNRGRKEGVEAAEARFDGILQALTDALDEVGRLRESLARNSSRDMLRMVMAISEQVIRRSLECKPEIVLSLIENALQASVQADFYRIRVSPQDLELVKQQKPLFLASISGLKNIAFEADPAITPGGCRVESEIGDVDATIETQLEEIGKVLARAIAGES